MTINIPNDIDNITFNGNDLDELKVNGTTIWSSGIHPKPMYIESKQNGSKVTLSKTGNPSETYYTSSDNKTAYQAYTYGTSITLNAGDRLYWYSPTQAVHSSSDYVQFAMTGNFKVGGNIQSLNNYSTSVGDYGYYKLFFNCSVISDISELKLPATTVGGYGYCCVFFACYNITTPPTISVTTFTGSYNCMQMFYNCTSLTTAPILPATSVTERCCDRMFSGCRSLTTIPANMLPATTLARYCYYETFGGCTSLTTVPSNMLPANTLAERCYMMMFYNCTSLTTAPELSATILATYCYSNMFNSCTSLSSVTALFTNPPTGNYPGYTSEWLKNVSSTGTFTMSVDATWNPENYRGESGVPTGWTVRTYTIYDNPMYIESKQDGSTFYLSKYGNPSETYYTSPDNRTDAYQAYTYGTTITLDEGERLYFYSPTQAVHSYSDYVQFAMTGNFKVGGNIQSLNNYSTSVGDYGYYQLFYGCSAITDVSDLLLTATTLSNNSYHDMFKGCSSMTSSPEIPATTVSYWSCCGMFFGCTSMTTAASILPATTLAEGCYRGMYRNTGITAAPILPAASISTSGDGGSSYMQMFQGSSSLASITCYLENMPSNGLDFWVDGVSGTGTFTMSANATWNPESWRGESGVPVGWTVTTVTPQ